jgi:hypothetical protein
VKTIKTINLLAFVVLIISPASLHAFELGPGGLVPVAVPAGSVPLSPVKQADFDGNGHPETLMLSGGRASVLSEGGVAWESPATWEVIQAEIADLNHDGHPEATLLVWRPFQPWPIDRWLPVGGRTSDFHDSGGDSCHLILVGWARGGYREVWAGSAMVEPVTTFATADLDGDGPQELVALEATYEESRSAPARALKVWEWNGFGFTIVSEVEGKFDQLAIIRVGSGRILILVP